MLDDLQRAPLTFSQTQNKIKLKTTVTFDLENMTTKQEMSSHNLKVLMQPRVRVCSFVCLWVCVVVCVVVFVCLFVCSSVFDMCLCVVSVVVFVCLCVVLLECVYDCMCLCVVVSVCVSVVHVFMCVAVCVWLCVHDCVVVCGVIFLCVGADRLVQVCGSAPSGMWSNRLVFGCAQVNCDLVSVCEDKN